jgi:hypothetical protein
MTKRRTPRPDKARLNGAFFDLQCGLSCLETKKEADRRTAARCMRDAAYIFAEQSIVALPDHWHPDFSHLFNKVFRKPDTGPRPDRKALECALRALNGAMADVEVPDIQAKTRFALALRYGANTLYEQAERIMQDGYHPERWVVPDRQRYCTKCRGKVRWPAVYGDLCGHHYALEVDKFEKRSRKSRLMVK